MANRRMPVRTATLDFTEDGYPGFTCKRWLNPTIGALRRLREATDEDTSRKGWLDLFPEWDFVDEDGLEIAHTPEGFDLVPDELFIAMIRRGTDAVKEAALPANLNVSSSEPKAEVSVSS